MGGGENREVARRFCGGKRMQGVGRKVGWAAAEVGSLGDGDARGTWASGV